MKNKTQFVFLVMTFFVVTIKESYSSQENPIEEREQCSNAKKQTSQENLTHEERIEARAIFLKDYISNSDSLTKSRSFFGYTAGIANSIGKVFLYTGSGLFSVALPIQYYSEYASDALLLAGACCFGAHLTLSGIAKCSAREEEKREKQLQALAREVDFKIVNLQPDMTDDPSNANLQLPETLQQKNAIVKKTPACSFEKLIGTD
jgi:hypothetical protein